MQYRRRPIHSRHRSPARFHRPRVRPASLRHPTPHLISAPRRRSFESPPLLSAGRRHPIPKDVGAVGEVGGNSLCRLRAPPWPADGQAAAARGGAGSGRLSASWRWARVRLTWGAATPFLSAAGEPPWPGPRPVLPRRRAPLFWRKEEETRRQGVVRREGEGRQPFRAEGKPPAQPARATKKKKGRPRWEWEKKKRGAGHPSWAKGKKLAQLTRASKRRKGSRWAVR
uniref:Uncharacterized protein n=1 Tax=Setaria viridis TaxID=4556 RepID=A0A4U6TR22_SETVI|nr:hypothetical protein SEVIR_8G081200v2 [Setaria viridis]